MKDKSHGHYLGAHFYSEDPHEVGLQLLQLEREDGLVSVGEVGVHGHNHAVGDDGQDDAVLEWSRVHQPLHQPSRTILLLVIIAILVGVIKLSLTFCFIY